MSSEFRQHVIALSLQTLGAYYAAQSLQVIWTATAMSPSIGVSASFLNAGKYVII
jgi:hypothetical protein